MIQSTDEVLSSLAKRFDITKRRLPELSYYRYRPLGAVLHAVLFATNNPTKSILLLATGSQGKTLHGLSKEISEFYLHPQTNGEPKLTKDDFKHSARIMPGLGFIQTNTENYKFLYTKDIDGLFLGDPFAFSALKSSSEQSLFLNNVFRLSGSRSEADSPVAALLFLFWLRDIGGHGTVRRYDEEVGYLLSNYKLMISRLANSGLIQRGDTEKHLRLAEDMDYSAGIFDKAGHVAKILQAMESGELTPTRISRHTKLDYSTVISTTTRLADRGVLKVSQYRGEAILLERGYSLLEQLDPLLMLIGFHDAYRKSRRDGHRILGTNVLPDYEGLLHYRRTHLDPLLENGLRYPIQIFRNYRRDAVS